MDSIGRNKSVPALGILYKSLRGEGFIRNHDMMLFFGVTAFPVGFYSIKTVLPKTPGSVSHPSSFELTKAVCRFS